MIHPPVPRDGPRHRLHSIKVQGQKHRHRTQPGRPLLWPRECHRFKYDPNTQPGPRAAAPSHFHVLTGASHTEAWCHTSAIQRTQAQTVQMMALAAVFEDPNLVLVFAVRDHDQDTGGGGA